MRVIAKPYSGIRSATLHQPAIACSRTGKKREITSMDDSQRAEFEREATVLTEQANRLIEKLNVDTSEASTFTRYSPALRLASEAYERLNIASQRALPTDWEQARIDGISAAEITDQLHKVCNLLLEDAGSRTGASPLEA
jgi:hypothetical protein